MAKEERSLRELEQQIVEKAQQRQEKLTEEIGQVSSELEEMLGLSVPIQLSDTLREEIDRLTALVGTKPQPKKSKPKEDYRGKNISTEQKVAFVQEALQQGPLSKKEMLDRAEAQYDRSVAPTFLDTAIDKCLEDELIEETGDKKGRSIVYALAS